MIIFLPKKIYINIITNLNKNLHENFFSILIIIIVVIIHLIEVNFIDSIITEFTQFDFTNNIQKIEGDIVFKISQYWTPLLIYFFTIMYIIIYPFTLWFSPLYFLIINNKKSIKTISYGLLLIYSIALPFYLFIPITNVYTYYNLESALNSSIPTIENFFYKTTTHNNCLPSLHVAMTILIARSIQLTNNKKLTYFAYFCMISVIISVIYLAIHWITDVILGILISLIVIFILNHIIKDK